MDEAELFHLADEAGDVLSGTLTEEDRVQLQEVYKAISKQTQWGKAIDKAFPTLLGLVEEMVKTEDVAKEGGPWFNVLEHEQCLFDDKEPKAMARQHLLLLLIAKKLLGGLKTRVNQGIRDVRVLSQEEEVELEALVEEAVEAQDLRDLVDGWNSQQERKVVQREVVAQVDIAPQGGCRGSGRHERTTVYWERLNGILFREVYCKDCRQVIEKVKALRQAVPKECQHPNAKWVEGKEGKEAVCPSCKNPIEDPSTYHWTTAGLEPYGDDPSQDEAITLCSDY